MTKPYKVSFEEGWADELLEDGLTQEQFDALVDGIQQLLETGEIISTFDEQEEIPKQKRH
jgi:hypothetical protein